jgi:hypothetical protein
MRNVQKRFIGLRVLVGKRQAIIRHQVSTLAEMAERAVAMANKHRRPMPVADPGQLATDIARHPADLLLSAEPDPAALQDDAARAGNRHLRNHIAGAIHQQAIAIAVFIDHRNKRVFGGYALMTVACHALRDQRNFWV